MGECLHASGIATIIICSFVLDLHTTRFMSEAGAKSAHFLLKTIAELCEITIFAYLGVSLAFMAFHFSAEVNVISFSRSWGVILIGIFGVIVSRVMSVYPIAWISNKIQTDVIPSNVQHAIAFSGTRGVISLALAVSIPQFDQLTQQGSQYVSDIITITTSVILFSCFLSLTSPWVYKTLGVKRTDHGTQRYVSSKEKRIGQHYAKITITDPASKSLLPDAQKEDTFSTTHFPPLLESFRTISTVQRIMRKKARKLGRGSSHASRSSEEFSSASVPSSGTTSDEKGRADNDSENENEKDNMLLSTGSVRSEDLKEGS
jgi:NhaP-type Na+/H+ or K+/H+ antiporter